jgi:hypothetical protein
MTELLDLCEGVIENFIANLYLFINFTPHFQMLNFCLYIEVPPILH